MAKTVFDVLLEKFEQDVQASSEFLANGGAKDFAEYQTVVGRVRGLRLAIQTTKDLQQHQIGNDDDD
jgi:hypothetical protein